MPQFQGFEGVEDIEAVESNSYLSCPWKRHARIFRNLALELPRAAEKEGWHRAVFRNYAIYVALSRAKNVVAEHCRPRRDVSRESER